MATEIVLDVMTGEQTEKPYTPAIPDGEISYTLFKTTVWKRMTEAEAEIVLAAKAQQPARFQAIWDDALMIDTSDAEFFPLLQQFLVSVLTTDRAAELLATE